MDILTKAREFWRRNQTVLLVLPLVLFLMQLAYVVLTALDSRIGIEGFGDLFGYLLNAVRAVLIVWSAWWIKRHCWFDLHQNTELDLFERARDHSGFNSNMLSVPNWAFWLVVKDRAEWVAALAFATWWFTR